VNIVNHGVINKLHVGYSVTRVAYIVIVLWRKSGFVCSGAAVTEWVALQAVI